MCSVRLVASQNQVRGSGPGSWLLKYAFLEAEDATVLCRCELLSRIYTSTTNVWKT